MTATDRYQALFGRGDSTERIEFFSDAVFAIAMTLLVLDIGIPQVDDADLGGALREVWPEFFAYALSFALIAGSWASHHRKFRVITGYDDILTRLNLVLLFLIAFLPFPTSVLSEYGDETPAVVLYAVTVGSINVMHLAIFMYARRAGLLDDSVDDGICRVIVRNGLVAPIVFAVSVAITFVSPLAAMLSWIALAPLSAVVGRFADAKDSKDA